MSKDKKIETYKLYNGEVTLLFDPVKHIYTVDGKKKESVTGITKVIDKPAILYWAVNQAVELLAETLKPGVAYDEIQIKQLLQDAKVAHRRSSTEAADIGTLVHEATDIYKKTRKIKKLVNPKAKACFNLFLKWVKKNKVRFIESERKVYSRKLDYAGTMDSYLEMNGKFFVEDEKTSSGIYDEFWYQTSGYQQAYQEETGAKVDGQLVVRVSKEGVLEVKENYDYKKNVIAFNGALMVCRRKRELKDEKKGGD